MVVRRNLVNTMCCCRRRQGRVAVGSDADLLVWDAAATHSVSLKSQLTQADVNVYDGMTFTGAATHVIHAGRVVRDELGVRISITRLISSHRILSELN